VGGLASKFMLAVTAVASQMTQLARFGKAEIKVVGNGTGVLL